MLSRYCLTRAAIFVIVLVGGVQFRRQAKYFSLDYEQHRQNAETNAIQANGITMRTAGSNSSFPDEEGISIRVASPSKLANTTGKDPHFSNIEFLDLFDWEVNSLLGIDGSIPRPRGAIFSSCQPPSGIHEGCCIGTLGHAEKAISQRNLCGNKSLELYHSLRDSVLREHMPALPSTEPTKCDLCRIMDLCLEHNITFGIWGDSVTRQMMESLECGLLRRGYQVVKPQIDKAYTKYVISSPEWGDDSNVTMHVYIQYQVIPNLMKNPQAPGSPPDVNAIMTSYGLHFSIGSASPRHHPDGHTKGLHNLFTHLRTFSKSRDGANKSSSKFKLILHREASAQHFDAEGGDFFLAREKKEWKNESQLICVPFQWGPKARWREYPVQNATLSAGFDYDDNLLLSSSEQKTVQSQSLSSRKSDVSAEKRKDTVVMLPFFDFTSTLHDFHPSNQDCTHYCYNPYMWWPLWRSLRITMDKSLRAQSQRQSTTTSTN